MKTILIAGGTGYVGSHLLPALLDQGYTVHALSRRLQKSTHPNLHYFLWPSYEVPEGAWTGVSTIINLCGAPLAEKPWTEKRKKEILESRVEPLHALKAGALKHGIAHLISISAVGYYPEGNHTEASGPGTHFLSEVCVAWENAAKAWGIPCTILRLGLVMSRDAPLVKKLYPFAKRGINTAVGNGEQLLAWIDSRDLTRIFLYFLSNPQVGEYNACAPQAISMNTLSSILMNGKKSFLPNAPAFLVRLVLGQRADLLLQSISAPPLALQKKGFSFAHPTLRFAP